MMPARHPGTLQWPLGHAVHTHSNADGCLEMLMNVSPIIRVADNRHGWSSPLLPLLAVPVPTYLVNCREAQVTTRKNALYTYGVIQ